MRDTVKTLAGLALIAVIVVATFMYGNAQRQSQLKHDQQVQQAQQAKANINPIAATTPTPAAKASSEPVTGASGSGTAPVQTPQSNAVQGGTTSKATPAPAATPVTVAAAPASAPKTGANGTPLPQTGSAMGGLVGVAAVIGSVVALRRSKQTLLHAVRSRSRR